MQIQWCEGAVLSRAETVLQGTTHDTVHAEIGYGKKVSRRLWLKKLEEEIGLTARQAVALMFFAGLRPGEARGICWEHYDGKRLFVTQSVWHKFTTDPKTLDAASPLAGNLSDLIERDGNPSTRPIL